MQCKILVIFNWKIKQKKSSILLILKIIGEILLTTYVISVTLVALLVVDHSVIF